MYDITGNHPASVQSESHKFFYDTVHCGLYIDGVNIA